MSLGAFSVSTINLTSKDLVTGLNNTANVYWVEGINRELSIAELVIAICLNRASEVEAQVVGLMESMSETTRALEELTHVESLLVAKQESGINGKGIGGSSLACHWGAIVADLGEIPSGCSATGSWVDYVNDKEIRDAAVLASDFAGATATSSQVENAINAIESRLDALNTISQETLIKLQSLTNKRDQTYDLITAMTKSTLTAGTSISANMR